MNHMSYDYNLYQKEVRQNPYVVFEKMHACGTVHWNEKYKAWFVVGHESARELLKNTNLSSNILGMMRRSTFPISLRDKTQPLWDVLKSWLLFSDPPYHTHLRQQLNFFFSRIKIKALRKDIEKFVYDALNVSAKKFDFMEVIARPLPVKVISIVMGLPISDVHLFRRWNAALVDFIDLTFRTPETVLPALRVVQEQQNYLCDFIQRVLGHNLFVTQLDQVLKKDELLNRENLWKLISLLLVTSSETTTNLIGNGLYALLNHPEQYDLLIKNPELMPQAIQEILRYDPPIQSVFRRAVTDINIGENVIKQNQFIQIILAAINRDSKQFTNPHQFDITRQHDKHMSFGYGIHFCLGWFLAQTIGEIFFTTLLKKFPDIKLCLQEYDWSRGVMLRGLKSLWVKV